MNQSQPLTRDFEKEELRVWNYLEDYVVDVLNGDLSLDELRENLASFRNTASYTGNQEKYKTILED